MWLVWLRNWSINRIEMCLQHKIYCDGVLQGSRINRRNINAHTYCTHPIHREKNKWETDRLIINNQCHVYAVCKGQIYSVGRQVGDPEELRQFPSEGWQPGDSGKSTVPKKYKDSLLENSILLEAVLGSIQVIHWFNKAYPCWLNKAHPYCGGQTTLLSVDWHKYLPHS